MRLGCRSQAGSLSPEGKRPDSALGGSLVGPALFARVAAVGHQRCQNRALAGDEGLQAGEPSRAEPGRIEAPQHAAQGLLARHPAAAQERVAGQAEGGQFLGCRTPVPLRCRGDRVVVKEYTENQKRPD